MVLPVRTRIISLEQQHYYYHTIGGNYQWPHCKIDLTSAQRVQQLLKKTAICINNCTPFMFLFIGELWTWRLLCCISIWRCVASHFSCFHPRNKESPVKTVQGKRLRMYSRMDKALWEPFILECHYYIQWKWTGHLGQVPVLHEPYYQQALWSDGSIVQQMLSWCNSTKEMVKGWYVLGLT